MDSSLGLHQHDLDLQVTDLSVDGDNKAETLPSVQHQHTNGAGLMAKYEYQALPRRSNFIRILNLFPSEINDQGVSCELLVVPATADDPMRKPSTSENKKYEALSWCWGRSKPTEPIAVLQNGTFLAKYVSPELATALKALRRPQDNRYLWIDAICINQDDPLEKNHQVMMMSAIYRLAEGVCVWLGPGVSTTAFNFIKDELLHLHKLDNLCNDHTREKWIAFIALMQRPWFSRRWVVQEIALARSATIHCGMDTMSWKDFATAVELLVEMIAARPQFSEIMKKDPIFGHVESWVNYVSTLGASLLVSATAAGKLLQEPGFMGYLAPSRTYAHYREVDEMEPVMSLEYLVSSLNVFGVTVEHDAIYALLALSRDGRPKTGINSTRPTQLIGRDITYFPITYEVPYVDVCMQFTQFCIRRAQPMRALDILCRPWSPKREVGQRNVQMGVFATDSEMNVPSWVPQLSTSPSLVDRKNPIPLVGLPDEPLNYAASGTRTIDTRSLRFRKRVKFDKHFSMYVKGIMLDKIETVVPSTLPNWIEAFEWEGAPFSDPPDAFWRTLVADRTRDGRKPPRYYSYACRDIISVGLRDETAHAGDVRTRNSSSVIAQYHNRMQAVIGKRSLVKTISGNIGLTSEDVKEGDLVCILYGCSVPIVLRRYKKTWEEAVREREEDFVQAVIALQRRWRNYLQRVRLARLSRALRFRKSGFKDPLVKFYTVRKYAMRWRKLVMMQRVWMLERTFTKIAEIEQLLIAGRDRHEGSLQDEVAQFSSPQEQAEQKAAIATSWSKRFDFWLTDLPRDPEDDIYYYYRFLGEAYIHCMMDGQALTYANHMFVKTNLFELR